MQESLSAFLPDESQVPSRCLEHNWYSIKWLSNEWIGFLPTGKQFGGEQRNRQLRLLHSLLPEEVGRRSPHPSSPGPFFWLNICFQLSFDRLALTQLSPRNLFAIYSYLSDNQCCCFLKIIVSILIPQLLTHPKCLLLHYLLILNLWSWPLIPCSRASWLEGVSQPSEHLSGRRWLVSLYPVESEPKHKAVLICVRTLFSNRGWPWTDFKRAFAMTTPLHEHNIMNSFFTTISTQTSSPTAVRRLCCTLLPEYPFENLFWPKTDNSLVPYLNFLVDFLGYVAPNTIWVVKTTGNIFSQKWEGSGLITL